MADGSKTLPTDIGWADPLPFIPLTFVLHVPSHPFSLISISRLTHSLNWHVIFDSNFVLVQDWGMGRMIGTGREFEGLYHLALPSSMASACATTGASSL